MRKICRKKSSALEEPAVNLTPLIDVVFVILIGFIIIAPLLEIDRIDLAEASTVKLPNHRYPRGKPCDHSCPRE